MPTLHQLPIESVYAKIKQALINAETSLRSTVTQQREPTNHVLPISESFIREHFGCTAFQMFSGQSVVIIDEGTKKVYKHCLSTVEMNTSLLLLRRELFRKTSRAVFPEEVKQVRQTDFFVYPLLTSLLKPREAKSVAKTYVKLVCEAIEELHTKFKIAHLDVRLPIIYALLMMILIALLLS